MTNEELRAKEVNKYSRCYNDKTYRMGNDRRASATTALRTLPFRESYLDVGCGRGEIMRYAKNDLKFNEVMGTETVDQLLSEVVVKATVDNLPFYTGRFEVVSMMDVIEHLNEFDLEAACLELQRVASRAVIITACNLDSIEGGVQLHITKKPYNVWDEFFKSVFKGKVVWRKDLKNMVSETWIVKL